MADTMKITLTKNRFAVVDRSDFVVLNKFKWHYSIGYAMRREGKKIILMHRMIMNTPDGMETDHVNGDGLDNRRKNLRICTRSQNNMNRHNMSLNKSGFRGVSWKVDKGKWRATLAGKHLGHFKNKKDAAIAYDVAAVKLFGEFARPNFPCSTS